MNLFAGAGALGMCYDDFNADNFDHSDLKFIHGGVISLTQTGKRPIESNATPPGTHAWGSEFKKAAAYNFNRSLGIGAQGASIAYKTNYLSLDKTYKDAYGLPLLRMTYNFTDQDRALFDYITKKIEEVAKAMNPKAMASKPSPKDYNIVPYQTTHNTGGTITGKSPEDSVVNSYLQHWDAENLFVVGAGNFPHNGGCNPTGTVGALGYRCAEGILVTKALKSKYGLTYGTDKSNTNTRKLRNAERAKYEIHNAVKDALKGADSWQKFKNELAKRGVLLELVYKDKERTKVQGIRFCKDGYSFKGTQISRDYSFGKLNARFEGTENLLSARAKSAQQYEQDCHKNEQMPFMSESSQDPWGGISSIGLFAPANAQTFEQFPEDESSKKKKKKRRRGFSL